VYNAGLSFTLLFISQNTALLFNFSILHYCKQPCRNITSLITGHRKFFYGRRPACSIAYFYRPMAGSLVQAFAAINKTLLFWALFSNWYVNAGKDWSDFQSCFNVLKLIFRENLKAMLEIFIRQDYSPLEWLSSVQVPIFKSRSGRRKMELVLSPWPDIRLLWQTLQSLNRAWMS
jgi:hypothetical protein